MTLVYAILYPMKDERKIGVGPHPKPWPTDEKYDSELLENGDRRNVEDAYRYWTVEAIKADLATKAVSLEIAIENWQHDSNIGTIVRTANAFNVSKVHIIGRRHWNRRGAMVTDKYMSIEQHSTVQAFLDATAGKIHVAIDNVPGATSLAESTLPNDCIMIFGGEGPGISDELLAACQTTIMIEQFGSTRSMNIGVAAGILMYEWRRQRSYHR